MSSAWKPSANWKQVQGYLQLQKLMHKVSQEFSDLLPAAPGILGPESICFGQCVGLLHHLPKQKARPTLWVYCGTATHVKIMSIQVKATVFYAQAWCAWGGTLNLLGKHTAPGTSGVLAPPPSSSFLSSAREGKDL